MPKIFKDPSRHFKSSDHHKKPHITLVNGMGPKLLANYILNGIKDRKDTDIVRMANDKGHVILYFRAGNNENIFSSINKSDVKENRARLKGLLATLGVNFRNEFESKKILNLIMQLAI